MTRCESCHSLNHTHRAVQCCGCLQQHFPFCLVSGAADIICWVCPLCGTNPPERLIVLQELARSCKHDANNSCAVATLVKPINARLVNHKQKGKVLDLDVGYKGPYCEGIPLPHLLHKMASQPIGECLVKEIPRAAAASDAPSKLYRFINSSGNYATVMAIELTEYGDQAGTFQRGDGDSQFNNIISLSVDDEQIRGSSSGKKRKKASAVTADSGASFSFPKLKTPDQIPDFLLLSTGKRHRNSEPQSASAAHATGHRLRLDTIGSPRELTEKEIVAKQAEIMRMLSCSPKTRRLRSPYLGWLHSAVHRQQLYGRVHQLYKILCYLQLPDSHTGPQVTERWEKYMLELLDVTH